MAHTEPPSTVSSPRRPIAEARPCPGCGAAVDPFRALSVAATESAVLAFCGPDCVARWRLGAGGGGAAPSTDGPVALRSAHRSDPSLRSMRRRRGPRGALPAGRSDWTSSHAAIAERDLPLPALPLTLAVLGLVTSLFATGWTLVSLASVMGGAAAAWALVAGHETRRAAGWLPWVLAPAGAIVSVLAGFLAFAEGSDPRSALAGGAIAAGAASLRGWLDARARWPLERLFAEARGRMPASTRVPDEGAPRAVPIASRTVETSLVRAGEDVLVADGETVPADGTVRAGDAMVLLHPRAEVATRRVAGDAVLAGAKVVAGSLRILAARVGRERALLRPTQFGDGSADDAARVTRWIGRGLQVAGVVVVAALGVAMVAAGGGVGARLAAVASVLLAIPLLALRRASEAPFVAAGAIASLRGIVFQSARALDRAGRVNAAVLCTHGTVTEGTPEVVELHPAAGVDVGLTLGLAAAAEQGVEHPIAAAVQRYAERMGVVRAAVRRVVAVPGRGLTAVGGAGEPLVVGSRQLLLDEGVSVASLDLEAERAEQRGLSVVFVGFDRRVRALLALRDEERPGARAAIQRLMDLDIESILMSGDHRGTVEGLARSLDVAHVKAELPPEQRGAEVRRLREAGSAIAVIGRPAHDDPALGAADVPIVLGAAGVDRAVSIASDDVRDAADALWLAHAARHEAHRAVGVAVSGGVALLALAANGFLPPALVALGALAIDAYALPASARLLRRIELRMPGRG